MYAVYYNERYWWHSYETLKTMCDEFDRLCDLYEESDGEEGVCGDDYQADSPYAEYISGYNTDTFADECADIIAGCWESYLDECEDEGKTPSWNDGWDNYIWTNFDYQLCHTWLRVTNIHTEDDEEIKRFAKESDYSTMEDKLGLKEYC